uniref:Uncharacterized protein n=1 Tax=Setaria viridis TaxID=4556 RepID=A0A4V6D1W6_SETVI|nr:hypothetical protein SEVIR_9G419850v2 [Setaria viridis]
MKLERNSYWPKERPATRIFVLAVVVALAPLSSGQAGAPPFHDCLRRLTGARHSSRRRGRSRS